MKSLKPRAAAALPEAPEPFAPGSPITAVELVGSVVESRISDVIAHAAGSRVVYAIVDLGPELTSAIGEAVSRIPVAAGRIEVAIHSDLAVDGLAESLRSDDVATRFRNRKEDGVVATVFSVPGRQMEEVLQSLGSVQRINEAWLCDPAKAAVWAEQTLPGYDGAIPEHLTNILRGLMDADILASARMLANFCVTVRAAMTGRAGLPLMKAVNRALPCLRLPRDCVLDAKAEAFSRSAAAQFRRLRDEYQPHFYLMSRKGDVRPRNEMLARIDELEGAQTLEADAAEALRSLVNDRAVTTGIWRESQRKVAEMPWSKVRAFFDERAQKRSSALGEDTARFLDDDCPGALTDEEREILEHLRRETGKASPEQEAFFVRHRERLRGEPKLYRRWERLVFDKPIEEDNDLLVGLVRLAERAFQGADDVEDPVLLVRLRGAERLSYWTSEKNTDLCAYLRDRYRGLDKVLKPHAELRWGMVEFGG